MAKKEPTPPRSFSERDNPLLALLGNKTQEERITQNQTDQLVETVESGLDGFANFMNTIIEGVQRSVFETGNWITRELGRLQEIMVEISGGLTGLQNELTNPRPLTKSKEEKQEEQRSFNAMWGKVFDFFGEKFDNLKDLFKTKTETSWWDLIKEAAFWITAVGLAYFWRLYKVVDTVIDAVRGIYTLIKEGRLLTAIGEYFKGITSRITGWFTNLFKIIREGVYTRIVNLFQRILTIIKESKLFRLFAAIGKDISRIFRVVYARVAPFVNFIIRELGLLLKEIKGLAAIAKGSKVATAAAGRISAFFSRISSLFNAARAFVTSTFSTIVTRVSSIFARTVELFTNTFGRVGSFITAAFSRVSSVVTRVFNLIAPNTFGVVSNFVNSIRSLFQGGGTLGRIIGTFGRIASTFMRVGKSVFGVVKSIGSWIVRFVPFVGRLIRWIPILGWIITAIDGIVGAVKGFFASEGKNMLERIGMVFQGIIAGIISGLSLGFLEFDTIMGWFDTATDWLGSAFAKIYMFFTDTLPSFFTETIPNFFTQTIPNFFSWLGNAIWNGVKQAAQIAWDAITYPFVMIGDFFSNLVTDLKIMFAKIDLWIAEAMNIFGADEDDPAVIAAKKRLAQLEGRRVETPYEELSPRQQDAYRNKKRMEEMASRRRADGLDEMQRELREKEREEARAAFSTGGGSATMNVVNTTNAATTAVSTGKQPATESDPALRRAAGNIPYYGAGI